MEHMRSPVPSGPSNDPVLSPQQPDRRNRRHPRRDATPMAGNTDASELHSAPDNQTSSSLHLAELYHPAGCDPTDTVSADNRQDPSFINTNNDQPYNDVMMHSADPADMFRDANSFFDGSPSNDFSYDYTKLATEMSDYIIWNTADYTPWSTFHPYPTTQDTQNHPQYWDPGPSTLGQSNQCLISK